MSEITVGIRDLKARLSEYMHQVMNGQMINITFHGRVVGRIVPVENSLNQKMHALSEAGLVAWNGEKLDPLQPPAINRSHRQVSELLVEMRQ